jgi:hypothetical protein
MWRRQAFLQTLLSLLWSAGLGALLAVLTFRDEASCRTFTSLMLLQASRRNEFSQPCRHVVEVSLACVGLQGLLLLLAAAQVPVLTFWRTGARRLGRWNHSRLCFARTPRLRAWI